MTQIHERERELYREVATIVESRLPDVEVLAVELGGPERLVVYLDHPQGVDHALCERVTHLLREYRDRFSLEVSSPGLEPPLRKPTHFRRAIGRRVALRTVSPAGERSRLRGELVDAGERELTVLTGEGRVTVPYEAIVRGNLVDGG